jgi:hypothetical protein
LSKTLSAKNKMASGSPEDFPMSNTVYRLHLKVGASFLAAASTAVVAVISTAAQ